jgi:hypothetical protein
MQGQFGPSAMQVLFASMDRGWDICLKPVSTPPGLPFAEEPVCRLPLLSKMLIIN